MYKSFFFQPEPVPRSRSELVGLSLVLSATMNNGYIKSTRQTTIQASDNTSNGILQ